MLGKLIKHEFRATARQMLPLFLVVILLSCFMRLTASVLALGDGRSSVLRLLSSLFSTGYVTSMFVSLVFSVAMMVSRFYKNLMTDEGYLMFTLPVSIHQLLWSKLIVSAVWFLATFLVDALGVLIVSSHSGMLSSIASFFSDTLYEAWRNFGPHVVGFALEALVILLLGLIFSCLRFYAPIAIGHSFSGHKILLSVVFYFAFNIAWQIIGLTCMYGGVELLTADLFSKQPAVNTLLSTVHYSMLSIIGAAALACTVMYFITWRMLKRHLNLQ